jgi:hypothetical protein
MPRKRTTETLPKDSRLIKFEPGEIKPLFVKATDIDRVIMGLSPKTLANWRSQGIGPKYFLVNGSVYYAFREIETYFGKNPVRTINE